MFDRAAAVCCNPLNRHHDSLSLRELLRLGLFSILHHIQVQWAVSVCQLLRKKRDIILKVQAIQCVGNTTGAMATIKEGLRVDAWVYD